MEAIVLEDQKQTQFTELLTTLIKVGTLPNGIIIAMCSISNKGIEHFLYTGSDTPVHIKETVLEEVERKMHDDKKEHAVAFLDRLITSYGGSIRRDILHPLSAEELNAFSLLASRELWKAKNPILTGAISSAFIEKYSKALLLVSMQVPPAGKNSSSRVVY